MEIKFKLFKKATLYRNKNLRKALHKMAIDYGELRPALNERRIKKVWVAFNGENPIGWCGVYKGRWTNNENQLGVYVKTKYRKKGIGRKLLYLGISRLRKYSWYNRSRDYMKNGWQTNISPKDKLKDKRDLYGTIN